jgi:hypothetical protein
MKGVIWTKTIFDEFVKQAMLSDEEIAVVEASIKGWSQVKQSMELNMSISKINSILRRCRAKDDMAQKESDILPERKRTVKDTYCK